MPSQEGKRPGFWKSVRRALLGVDAFIDSAMYNGQRRALAAWQAIAEASQRLRLFGVGKVALDLVCEGLNLGFVGLVVVIAFALPAFRETSDDDWLKREDLAVTFLDRYGVEVGRRGIKHDDAIPFERIARPFHQGGAGDRGSPFLHPFRHRRGRHPARADRQRARRRRRARAARRSPSSSPRTCSSPTSARLDRKIKEAYLALWLEHHLTKKQILSLYLDRAYMGGGAFGVQAAAQFYFGKSARDIDLPESAMLAGLFKAPTKFSPKSICRRPARAPTTCSAISSTPAS